MTDNYEKILDEHFEEYQKLGGKKNRKEYLTNYEIFIEHTLDLWCYGDTSKYTSREKSLEAVQKITKINDDELDILFKSIDNVAGYS